MKPLTPKRIRWLSRLSMLIVATILSAGVWIASAEVPAPSELASAIEDPANLVRTDLLANVRTIQPGKPFLVGVHFEMKPKWHIYWKHPGDAGLATKIDVKVPEGFKVSPLRWPTPETFQQPGDIDGYGYSGKVLLWATVTPPKDLKPGTEVDIHAKVNWMACKNKCIPGSETLKLNLPTGDKAEAENQALFESWAKRTPRPAPLFALEDQDGNTVRLKDLRGQIVVLEWFNPDCPFVKRHHEKSSTCRDLAGKYGDDNVVWLAVNSTHYMTPEATRQWHDKWNLPYAVLIDRDGKVGKAYGAKTTPHMFVIDEGGQIVYHGALDDDPRGSSDSPENHIDAVLANLTDDKPAGVESNKSYGCSVKYKK